MTGATGVGEIQSPKVAQKLLSTIGETGLSTVNGGRGRGLSAEREFYEIFAVQFSKLGRNTELIYTVSTRYIPVTLK